MKKEFLCDYSKFIPLTFLFSLGQYDPKRNLTQHNFFIPKVSALYFMTLFLSVFYAS